MAKVELKQPIVAAIAEDVKDAQTVVLVDYRGLTVGQVTELRKQLREAGVEFKVYKNTLTRRAVEIAELTDLNESLTGPNAIAFSANDVVAPAKIINDFAKEHEALELKAGIVEGKVAGLEDLKRYAAIPSRDTLLTMLAAGLMGTVRDLSICLDLYSKEKENN
mgnify:CR=1 FL=1